VTTTLRPLTERGFVARVRPGDVCIYLPGDERVVVLEVKRIGFALLQFKGGETGWRHVSDLWLDTKIEDQRP
jgi:hypothetical protein